MSYIIILVLTLGGHSTTISLSQKVYYNYEICKANADFLNSNNTNPTTQYVCVDK